MFFVAMSLLAQPVVKADEGMWLLILLQKANMQKMQSMGLKLTAEDLYSVNKASLKDAVVSLDHGSCTAELISSQGLMLTNHHCGYGEIQSHSSVKDDYLTDGFWAKSFAEELPNPGKTATFLVRVEDVSAAILASLTDDMTEAAREAKIKQVATELENKAIGDTHYEASVETFFAGNEFYLFVYETFKDIRLVGAPPSSVGKYGGDTDNWMWPRHTGDFSMFRIYCAPDGSPAEYSENNIPYTPKKYFPISAKGVEEGDFSMVMGYPGSTDRYLTSWGVKETMDITNDYRVKIRTKKLELIKEDMNTSDKIRIQYAAKYSQSSNYWKYSIGQNKGLKHLNVMDQKKKLESDINMWIMQDSARIARYGDALTSLEKGYAESEPYTFAMNYWFEAIWQGPEFLGFAYSAYNLYDALNKVDKDATATEIENMKEAAAEHFKNYNAPTDMKVSTAMLKMYQEDVDAKFQLSIFEEINKDYENDISKYIDTLFATSIFTDEVKFNAFLENPTVDELSKDMAFTAMFSALQGYFGMMGTVENYSKSMAKGKRLFIEALRKMNSDRIYYPDANSTMRMTYGKVGGYTADGEDFKHYTTLDEYISKEDKNNAEFTVAKKLKKLHKKKDYGTYGDDGAMKICFITDNDITGGNSGSPVINGNGELIGVAFDGNWEAMSGDIAFETEMQRCINVDIRFVLFIIEKYAGATNLIDEMTIVK